MQIQSGFNYIIMQHGKKLHTKKCNFFPYWATKECDKVNYRKMQTAFFISYKRMQAPTNDQ